MTSVGLAAPAAGALPGTRSADVRATRWIVGFVAFQFACQLLVISPLGTARTVVRAASMGASLVMLLLMTGAPRRLPAHGAAALALAILAVAIAHPLSDLPAAAPAQAAMYAAVLGPLFWVARLRPTMAAVWRLVLLMWGFHTVGAIVGTLQVYLPGVLDPELSPVIAGMGRGYVEQLRITLSSGVRVFRPMGLTDIPGGAAGSGYYAVLLGIGVFLTTRRPALVALAIGSMLAGMTCLYLSQIRALMVMTAISVIVLTTVLATRRDFRRLASLSVVVVVAGALSLQTALAMAEDPVSRRVASLTTQSPGQVYYDQRGAGLARSAQELLPEHPLGAGLGRWGMMAGYFGRGGQGERALWVEEQWTAWLVDGGVPLALAYFAAVVATLLALWRLSRRGDALERPTSTWAAVLLAYGVGTVALTFSYPVFVSQTGLEFWLLSTAVLAAAHEETVSAPGAA